MLPAPRLAPRMKASRHEPALRITDETAVEMTVTARDARGYAYDYGSFLVDVDVARDLLALLSGHRVLVPRSRASILPPEIAELIGRLR